MTNIAQGNFADLSGSDGDSDWVSVNSPGLTVTVDCVDANGDSEAFGSVTASLLYSPDAKMRAVVELDDGTKITGRTAAFARTIRTEGYVAVAGANMSGKTLRIKVQHAAE